MATHTMTSPSTAQACDTGWTVEKALRLVAGTVVMGSVFLGMFVHPNWYYFTLFVGANLFQSAFTNWCPMMTILRKAGLR
jgi:Protein of unknown function (DUF2892)